MNRRSFIKSAFTGIGATIFIPKIIKPYWGKTKLIEYPDNGYQMVDAIGNPITADNGEFIVTENTDENIFYFNASSGRIGSGDPNPNKILHIYGEIITKPPKVGERFKWVRSHIGLT